MKRLTYLLFATVIILSSCSHGMNKSIIEPMTVDELRANMKDTTFTNFYDQTQQFSKWILYSDVRQAKYGDITYKRLKKYDTHASVDSNVDFPQIVIEKGATKRGIQR